MTKLNSLFDRFLSNIEPDKDAVDYAQEAHKPVRDFLENDEKFGEYVENTFLYGSYRRHTAVGDIKDVDIVVLTNFDPESDEHTPQKVLRKLKAALARHYEDPENPEYQRRSIRINDPLPERPDVSMTLDIIPAVAPNGDDSPLLVPDREVKAWVQSHPKGHIKATSDLNRQEYSGGKFVPLVKMMKWWWKYQCQVRQPDVERPKPKGFWIECLTAEMFDHTQSAWADHFVAVLANIVEAYGDASEPPELNDPGMSGQTIKTNMTAKEFGVFMSAAKECLDRAVVACDQKDDTESSAIWREIFGDEFPLYDEPETDEVHTNDAKPTLGIGPQIEKLRWPKRLTRKVHIDAYTYLGDTRVGGINSDGRTLPAERNIQFVAKTNVRGTYEVYWQVVNTGKHAKDCDGLRGGISHARRRDGESSSNPLINWERTEYTGKHWIQCFIVQDGFCVAESKKFYVNIRNKEYLG